MSTIGLSPAGYDSSGDPSVQDHLGSTVKLTNIGGSVTESNSYDSFGRPTNASFSSRYQFTGREYDSFSGLQYSRARFYDPQIGRFISEDPIGFAGGDVNLYAYVKNNPLSGKDPSGLFLDPRTAEELARELARQRALWLAGGGAAGGGFAVGGAFAVGGVVGGGLVIGGAIGLPIGFYTANHPSNPFVTGPLNPWPFIDKLLEPAPLPITQGPKKPKCEPLAQPKPFTWEPPYKLPFPISPPLGPNNPPRDPDREEDCFNRCAHLLPSPSGDRQGSEFIKCFKQCMGRL